MEETILALQNILSGHIVKKEMIEDVLELVQGSNLESIILKRLENA